MGCLIILFTIWFVGYSGIPFTLHKLRNLLFETNRFRPFDCEKCLAFWLAIAYYHSEKPFDLILIAGSISLGTIILMTFKK
jgi:hypothetical protein